MTLEREEELLSLIESYWRARGWSATRIKMQRTTKAVQAVGPGGRVRTCLAVWAESEECLRDVGGECVVRSATVERYPTTQDGTAAVKIGDVWGEDPLPSVALLKAFRDVFGGEKR